MRFSYNKLWKLLIDRGIKKKELAEKAEISATSIAKLGKGGNINTNVLLNICTALECNIEDIMEIVPDDHKEPKTEEGYKKIEEVKIKESKIKNIAHKVKSKSSKTKENKKVKKKSKTTDMPSNLVYLFSLLSPSYFDKLNFTNIF